MQKNGRLSKNRKNRYQPQQTSLPGMGRPEPDIALDHRLGLVENPFVDRILALRRKKSFDQILGQIEKRYLDAETVLGIKTACGWCMRQGEVAATAPLNLLLSFFHELFKIEFKSDLHPLFPTVLEELGFSSDEARILAMWENFFHESCRSFFKQQPGLINLLARLLFPDSEANSDEEKLLKVLQNHLQAAREI